MAVSCPEVMYGAYYPYLYGRGAARSFHHAPHFQYDRLNVQSSGNASAEYAAAVGSGVSGASGSASSGASGAQSPGSPPHAHHLAHAHLAHHASPRLRAKEEDLSAHGRNSADASSESEGECGGAARARAQYVSANCVVFTHYSGDVAAVVDEHFARALALDKPKEGVPLSARNLPASFFNAAAGGGGACALELYEYDPWHQHYGYNAHRHAAEYHAHHGMAAGYGGLLLGRGSLHAQYKPVEWPHHAHHAHAAPHLDPAACSPYSYPAPPGLEAPVQDTSKDLYWF
ncbi:protein vestigial [Bicyclus anynana]|uniref:Protein vestigial n=1 Tax=Bicyclus anynana TaxID=110368 RepID=A0A6J1MHU4_BICAN|nr:protein vestigial [Bicyclus anynana]